MSNEAVDQSVSGPFRLKINTCDGEKKLLLSEVSPDMLLEAMPVRTPNFFPNQKNMPGKAYCSTNGDFVEYESLLERDCILIKDFDPRVTQILEQPFELEFSTGSGSTTHTPDLLVWESESLLVCDVKPARRLSDPRFELQVEATAQACSQVGWRFEVLTEPDPLFISNLRWLGGYREVPSDWNGESARMLDQVAQGPATIGELLSASPEPLMAKPVLMHLLWTQQIRTDLGLPLSDDSIAARAN